MSNTETIEIYRGIWGIKETFRVTKGVLETRPVYVSLQEHINAHFLTCFIAQTILRLTQKKTVRLFPAEKIVECLNRISCSSEHENVYLFDSRSEVSDAIGKALGIDFTNKRLRLGDIKNIWPKLKNEVFRYKFMTKLKGRKPFYLAGLRLLFRNFGVKVRIFVKKILLYIILLKPTENREFRQAQYRLWHKRHCPENVKRITSFA